MPDFSGHKLGKLAPKTDEKRLKLGKYLKPELAAPPVELNWGDGVTDWGMLGNDTLGDCTIAGVGHAVQSAMHAVGIAWDSSVETDEVIKYYEFWCGYNPADPTTDQGGVEVDVLNNWRKLRYAGHQLVAYADPEIADTLHIKQSIALFGGVYIGLALPLSAQNQDVWQVVGDGQTGASAPGSWGGHAVYVVGYSPEFLTCITWGQELQMSWDFFRAYADEAHTLFLGMWVENKTAPSGFDWAQLETDLTAIVG
jgi:hypothetical protein